MQNPRRIVQSQIQFEGKPSKLLKYLKKNKYEHSNEVHRNYPKDIYLIEFKSEAIDHFIFDFLQAHYILSTNGSWIEKP